MGPAEGIGELREKIRQLRQTEAECAAKKDWGGAEKAEDARSALEARLEGMVQEEMARLQEQEAELVNAADYEGARQVRDKMAAFETAVQSPTELLLPQGTTSDASPSGKSSLGRFSGLLSKRGTSSESIELTSPKSAAASAGHTSAQIRAMMAKEDMEIDLGQLSSLCAKARKELMQLRASVEGGITIEEILNAESRAAAIEDKRYEALGVLKAAWVLVKELQLEEAEEEQVTSLSTALDDARAVGIGLPSYHRKLVKEVTTWLAGGGPPLTARLAKRVSTMANSARSSLGMTTTARIQYIMTAPDADVDMYQLRELCRKARMERETEETKPNSTNLDKLLPVAEVEAAEARVEALETKRAEVALGLDLYVGDGAPTMAALDTDALGNLLQIAKECGVTHKSHLRTDGSSSRDLYKACEKLFNETTKARDAVNKQIQADLVCPPEKLNCLAMKVKGLDLAIKTGGVSDALLESANKRRAQVGLCVWLVQRTSCAIPLYPTCAVPSHTTVSQLQFRITSARPCPPMLLPASSVLSWFCTYLNSAKVG